MGSAFFAKDRRQVCKTIEQTSHPLPEEVIVHDSRRNCLRDSCHLLLVTKFAAEGDALWHQRLSQLDDLDEVALEGISRARSLDDVVALFFDP